MVYKKTLLSEKMCLLKLKPQKSWKFYQKIVLRHLFDSWSSIPQLRPMQVDNFDIPFMVWLDYTLIITESMNQFIEQEIPCTIWCTMTYATRWAKTHRFCTFLEFLFITAVFCVVSK